jgi:elongation factor G
LYEEKERGITIQSAVAKCQWKETTFHIIDTPGHIDFMNEVETCLQVLDAAVVILCGQSGIQAQTENLLRAKSMKNKPLIFYINKFTKYPNFLCAKQQNGCRSSRFNYLLLFRNKSSLSE